MGGDTSRVLEHALIESPPWWLSFARSTKKRGEKTNNNNRGAMDTTSGKNKLMERHKEQTNRAQAAYEELVGNV